jgi:hypothetical protein
VTGALIGPRMQWGVVVFWILSAAPTQAQNSRLPASQSGLLLPRDAMQSPAGRPARGLAFDPLVGRSQERFQLEFEGARSQAQDWLHDAGFSLLEERDNEGRRSYSVTSGALADDWPGIHLRARLGGSQLSAGLQPRHNAPAIAITIPWQRYTLEIEGSDDRALGYALTGTFRWSDPRNRVQYGVALPLALGGGPSAGALLQIGVHWGE